MKTVNTQTISYYNTHASDYAADTFAADCNEMYSRFTDKLAPGCSILDLGCGSGRDSKAFLSMGFNVTATDGSEEMCRIASANTGLHVRQLLFQDLDYGNEFDGVWACASILHLPEAELEDVFKRIYTALKPDGILDTSFKYGEFEGERRGRYFIDFTEEKFDRFLKKISGFKLEEQWISEDVRPERANEKWLNVILRKI